MNTDDFKAMLIEMGVIALKNVETRAREILKEVDEAKQKRKWLLSDKQKAQMELYEAVSKERTVMCMMMMDSERHAGVAARVLGGEEHAPLQDAGAPPPYQRRHVHHQLRSVRGVCVRDRW